MRMRSLSQGDVGAVHQLDLLCFPSGVSYDREMFEACLDDPCCNGWCIEVEGSVRAFAIVYYPGLYSAQVITVDVHPDFRRGGLAKALMDRIEQDAAERGVRRILLQVSTENGPALSLYKNRGYSTREVLEDYYGPGMNAYLMDKYMADREGRAREFPD